MDGAAVDLIAADHNTDEMRQKWLRRLNQFSQFTPEVSLVTLHS